MKIPFPKYEAEVVEEIEAYLDMHYQTEIVQEREDEYGLKYLSARGSCPARDGRPGTRRANNYARPMFNVIWHQSFSGAAQSVTPCQCYRFDRSWACDEHPEVAWDTKRRCWVRPGTAIWYELHPEDRPDGWESRASQPVPGPPVGLYDRLTAEWERQNRVSLADAAVAMRENVSPFTPDLRRRLDALPDASLTLTGTFTLEITGDTTQASASTERDGAPFRHTVRIEVRGSSDEVEGAERNDPTA